jgi:hypothetical protein
MTPTPFEVADGYYGLNGQAVMDARQGQRGAHFVVGAKLPIGDLIPYAKQLTTLQALIDL